QQHADHADNLHGAEEEQLLSGIEMVQKAHTELCEFPKDRAILRIALYLPPPPNPLPKGEGEPLAASELFGALRLCEIGRRGSLSPGERVGVRGKAPLGNP